jgi:SAM-dependent methyltransferase
LPKIENGGKQGHMRAPVLLRGNAMTEHAAKIRADFDRLAQFDVEAWTHNTHYHGFLLRQLPPRVDQALDIGCGAGQFARLLAARAEHVTALDLSPEMLRLARERSSAFPNIDYQSADFMTTDLPRAYYDVIASIATLHHMPLVPALERCRDALRPGGVLLILDLFQGRGVGDLLRSLIAIPASRAHAFLKNGRAQQSPEVSAAWEAHGTTDVYPTLRDVRAACASMLPGARVTQHLFWRYSIVWHKPK